MRASVKPASTALCAATALGLNACGDGDVVRVQDPVEVSYTVVAQSGSYGSTAGVQYTLVRSQTELANLFYAIDQSSAAPPVVDFSREYAYLATPGPRGSPGYGVSVKAVRRIPVGQMDALDIDIETSSPGSGCIYPQVVMAPYVIISFSRDALTSGIVNTNIAEVVRKCG